MWSEFYEDIQYVQEATYRLGHDFSDIQYLFSCAAAVKMISFEKFQRLSAAKVVILGGGVEYTRTPPTHTPLTPLISANGDATELDSIDYILCVQEVVTHYI